VSRPSLKNQRYQQIMDAYESCVARYGIEGATLERIANQAGLARPLIRHNVGNREELMSGLLQRFESRGQSFKQHIEQTLPSDMRLQALITHLFESDDQTMVIAYALVSAIPDYPLAQQLIEEWLSGLHKILERELAREYPQAQEAAVNAVAVGIGAIYANLQAIKALQSSDAMREQSRQAVYRLVESLKVSPPL